jgi:anthranilate phosphoribosyltransferase
VIRESLTKLVDGKDLIPSEAEELMTEIMSGNATTAQIAAILTALRMKGETIEEITAFSSVMRTFCHHIHPKVAGTLVDIVGTGGDSVKTFNISTIAAFVAAGAGIVVAKHGNRSVTSRCGSADVLEALGLNLKMSPTLVENSIETIGIGFMFAPTFHPAMRYAVTPRSEIGVRTVFNLLGPLTNPADTKVQLSGVYKEELTEPLAHVLRNLGVERAMVVHGLDGLDEISTIGRTKITSLAQQEVSTTYIDPKDLGFEKVNKNSLEVTTPDESVKIMFKILNDHKPVDRDVDKPKRDIVLANAAAAIFLGGKSESIITAIDVARRSIESGSAYNKLRELIKYSGGDSTRLEELEHNE